VCEHRVVRGEDTLFGTSEDPGRSISRDLVATVLIEAALQPAADRKVVEIVANPSLPAPDATQWFKDA